MFANGCGKALFSQRRALLAAALLALAPATARPAHGQAVAAALRSYFESLAAGGNFSGSVLVAREGVVLLSEGFGMADISAGTPNQAETVYAIASLTKGFTAVSLLKLAESGLLSLDDTVDSYLPGFPNGDSITIRNLLGHTSGLFDYFDNPDLGTNIHLSHTPQELLEYFIHQPLNFPPGTQFDYSHSNFITAGLIVESVSGLSFRDFLQQQILAPLNMTRSAYDPVGTDFPDRAIGYADVSSTPPTVAMYIHPSVPYAAAGMLSTVEDLYLWDQALYTTTLLDASSLAEMLTPGLGDYGLGWYIDTLTVGGAPRRQVWHWGALPGFHSYLSRLVDDGVTIILLLNQSPSLGTPQELRPVVTQAANMVLGPLSLGDRVWADMDNDGLCEPAGGEVGIDGVTLELYGDDNGNGQPDAGELLAMTTTSTQSGVAGLYSFASIPQGDYIVRVAPSNFASGGALEGLVSSTGNDPAPDPDNDVDDDDNGTAVAGGVESRPITLAYGTEPGPSTDDNPTLDLGFYDPPESISVTLSASPGSLPEPGGPVSYTLTIVNTSNAVTVNLDTLTDDVVGNLNGQGSCSLPQSVGVGASYACQYSRSVIGTPGTSVTTTATASGLAQNNVAVSDSDSATVTLTDVPSSLAVSVVAVPASVPEPGASVAVAVTVTNTSPADAVSLTSLNDDLVGDLNGVEDCALPQSLPVGGSYQCTHSWPVSGSPGDVASRTVTASGSDDDAAAVSASGSASVTVTDVPSSLAVSAAADPGSVLEPGGVVTYTATVTNTSLVDAVTLTSLSDDVVGDLHGEGTCAVPQSLATGEVYQCVYSWSVSGSAGDSATCTVTASGSDDDDAALSASDSATVFVVAGPAQVMASKEVDGQFRPAGTVEYRITLTNIAASVQPDNPGPELEDILPAELTLVDATSQPDGSAGIVVDPASNTVLWNGSIPAGGQVEVRIIATIDLDTVGEVMNQGTVFFDVNASGSNDGSVSTDDPTVPGVDDPTVFQVINALAIPALSPWSLLVLAALLLLAAITTLQRKGTGT